MHLARYAYEHSNYNVAFCGVILTYNMLQELPGKGVHHTSMIMNSVKLNFIPRKHALYVYTTTLSNHRIRILGCIGCIIYFIFFGNVPCV